MSKSIFLFFRSRIQTLRRVLQIPSIQVISIFCLLVLTISISIWLSEEMESFFSALWFSIVTITTTGYGDVVPQTNFGKSISILAMFTGITTVSLLTGLVTSSYFSTTAKKQKGHMSYKKMKQHIVVCGWKANMAYFLTHLCKKSHNHINIQNTVIIANPPQYAIDEIFNDPKIAPVKFIRGEYFDKNTLMKANVIDAHKVLVIPDEGIFDNKERIERPSTFEIDSRTVMTVISIKTLNKNVHVSAQLLERNFEVYLQKVNCDEILFSDEIHSHILIKSILQNGLTNILEVLIGQDNNSGIITKSIDTKFLGKKYSDFEMAFPKTSDSLLIGILENIGKHHVIWNEAIRDAQKTANFMHMVSKLKNVKNLHPYNPVLLPEPEYIIPAYSAAIILKRYKK